MARREQYIVKDFGEVTIPERWEEVTLKQFTDLMRLEGEDGERDIRDVIAVLTDNDREWVSTLPVPFVERLMTKLTFLSKSPDTTARNEIKIDGDRYSIKYNEDLTFGEYTDINTIVQQDATNYAAILAILCRRDNEEYNDQFTAHIDERVKMWEKQPITDVIPLVAFFLARCSLSETCSQAYMTEAVEAAGQLVQATEHLLKSGECRKLPMKSRIKAWWNIRKYKKYMRRLSSSTSAT